MYSGLGSMLSNSSANSPIIDDFALRKAKEMRTPTDDYHRAVAKNQVLGMIDDGILNSTNDLGVNAYLEDAYLRSKTGGQVGLSDAMFKNRI